MCDIEIINYQEANIKAPKWYVKPLLLFVRGRWYKQTPLDYYDARIKRLFGRNYVTQARVDIVWRLIWRLK